MKHLKTLCTHCTVDSILIQPLHISDYFFIKFTLHFATRVPPTPLPVTFRRNLCSLSPSHLSSVVSYFFPSTSRQRTDELVSRLERPIYFECKLNEPMHIGMQLLDPAATDHSVSISRRQVLCIFSYLLQSRAVTSFCS